MKRIRILELDGGGIRGIFSMQFLTEFCKLAGITKLTDAFDVICGTSIGGICSLGLAAGKEPSELLQILIEQGPTIFTYDRTTIGKAKGPVSGATMASIMTLPGVNPYVYNNAYNGSTGVRDNSQPLAQTLKNVLGDTVLGNIPVPVVITSVAYSGGSAGVNPAIGGLNCSNIYFPYASSPMSQITPVNFSNIQLPWTTGQEALAVNVGLTTSAAPIYFLPVQLDTNSDPLHDAWYIDGGLYTNTPTHLGMLLAKTLYPTAVAYDVLSVGTINVMSYPLAFSPQKDKVSLNPGDSLAMLAQSLAITIDGGVKAATLPLEMMSLYNLDNKLNFYRFQATKTTDPDTWALDNVSNDFPNCFITAANEQMEQDRLRIASFISRAGLG